MYLVLGGLFYLLAVLEIIFIRYKKIFFNIGIIIIFIIFAFNDWTPDLKNYKRIYNNAAIYLNDSDYEIGFLYFIELSKRITKNFSVFQILYSIFTISSLSYLLKRKSFYPSVCLSIFYFIPLYPNIVQMRQFLAFAFFYIFLCIKKRGVDIFFLVISGLFHKSMFLFIPILILKKSKLFKNTKKFLIVINLILFFIIFINFYNTSKYIYIILKFFNLERYLYASLNQATLIGDLYLIFPYFIIANFLLFFNKIKDKKFKEIVKYSFIFMIILIFYRDFTRFLWNLYLIEVIIFTDILKMKRKKILYFNIFFIISVLIFYQQFLLINKGEYFKIIKKSIEFNKILFYK